MGQIKQGSASKISHKCGIVSNILTNATIWAFFEWVKERVETLSETCVIAQASVYCKHYAQNNYLVWVGQF